MSKVRVDTISTLDDQFHVDVLDLIHVREDISEIQSQGSSTWSLLNAPCPVNAQVYHGGKQWLSMRENSVEPVEGEDWSEIVSQKAVTDMIIDPIGSVIISLKYLYKKNSCPTCSLHHASN